MDGKWVDSLDERRMNVLNPATGQSVGSVPVAGKADISRAINAAHRSFQTWSMTAALERANLLQKAYALLIERRDEIAGILTTEQGKPLSEAKGEVTFAAEYLRWYAEESRRMYGETIPASSPNKRLLVLKQPVGVVAAITPWNFPAQMIARKIAPALAAGCTVVVKPSEYTPFTAIAMFEVFEAAGFPDGVVNLVTTCPGSVFGDEIIENPKVKKITFTGSTNVGKLLMRGAATQVKKISMELGGHAPFIVFEDADIHESVEACIASKFRNAGQTCVCANRIYVHEQILEAFTARLVERVKTMKIGEGTEPGIEVGPLIHAKALERVQRQVDDAVSKGATVVLGGHAWVSDGLSGAFYEPTVITNVDHSMELCLEETFGPVAPLISFKTEAEVIQYANGVNYGLAAYVFTGDLERAIRVGEALEYGIVGLNDALPGVVQAPFGGWKESGVGVESGRYGLDAFLEIKYLSIGMKEPTS